MSGYFYSLASLAVLIALVCAVLPDSVVQHARLVCSLCVICLLCTPVLGLVEAIGQGAWELPQSWEDEENEQGDYEQLSKDLLAGQLQVLLERDQGLTGDQCRILLEHDAQGELKKVTLVLSGKAIWRDPDPIAAYVQGLLGCPCSVVLD